MDNQQKPPEHSSGNGYSVIDSAPKKRKYGIVLIIVAAIIILGLLSVWNISINGRAYSNADAINLEQITKIKIDSSSNVYVVPSDGSDLRVTIEGEATYEPNYKAEINGKSLSIEFNKNFILLLGYSKLSMTIEVPESYSGDFDLKTSSGLIEFDISDLSDVSMSSSSGSISVGDIVCGKLEVKASSGSINAGSIYSGKVDISSSSGRISVDDVTSESLMVDASSGSINFSSITAGNVDLESSSGSVTIDSLDADKTDINCSSGKITVNDVRDTSLKAKSSSGSIQVEYTDFGANSDVDLDASSGSITLSLPESSQFNLDAKASSGSINCDFDILTSKSEKNALSGKTESDASNIIKLHASSGNVNIYKN